MDGLMVAWERGVYELLGEEALSLARALSPEELQGYGGVLRGTFLERDHLPLTVRLEVEPWSVEERWQIMVAGRQQGEEAFWQEFASAPYARIPFLRNDFHSQCSECGETFCIHGAALTYWWLVRVRERSGLMLLLLNRRGRPMRRNVPGEAIARVPIALGTNLDRTRRELVAIVESSVKAASEERDNLFGDRTSFEVP